MSFKVYIIINEDGSDLEPSSGQQLYHTFADALAARIRPTQSIIRLRAESAFKGCNCSGIWKDYK